MCNESKIRNFWEENCQQSSLYFNEITNFIPFIGAGMSVPFGFDTWHGFLSDIIDSFSPSKEIEIEKVKSFTDSLAKKEYLQLADDLNEFLNNGIDEKIRIHCSREKKEPLYNYLALLKKMGIKNFITTNYDDVIESQYENTLKEIYPAFFNNFLEQDRPGYPYILKLHGSYKTPDNIIFTKSQYDKNYGSEDNDFNAVLNHIFTNKVMLFIGCSLVTDSLMEYIQKLASKCNIWNFAILEFPTTEKERQEKALFLTRLKMRPIWYPSGEHGFVYTILSMLADRMAEPSAPEVIKDDSKKPPLLSSKDEFAKKFNCYIDPMANSAFKEKKTDEICKAILAQVNLNESDFKQSTFTDYKDITLAYLCRLIDKSTEKYTFEIIGEPGTGKSTLLSMLYLYKLSESIDPCLVALIDLYHYDERNINEALKELTQHLSLIDDVVNSNKKILVFIDGLNKFIRKTDELQTKIYDKITEWDRCENIGYICAIGTMPDYEFPPFFKGVNKNHSLGYKLVLESKDVTLAESCEDNFSFLVDSLMRFHNVSQNNENNFKRLHKKFIVYCMNAYVTYAEFRTVNFLINCFTQYGEGIFNESIGKVYSRYYIAMLKKENLIKVAEDIAKFMLNPFDFPYPTKYPIVYKSPSIRNFMFAYYYVYTMENDLAKNLEIFNCILTPSINRFAVDLITQYPLSERKILANVTDNYVKNFLPHQRSQWSYFLGRLKSPKGKEKAINFLKERYEDMQSNFEEVRKDKDKILNLRSIAISLIYSGNNDLANDFYKKLIFDSKIREINRNFHIKYYTTTRYKVGDEDIDLDNPEIPTPDNIKKLYSVLYSSVHEGKGTRNYYLNIITLLDLVIFDHYDTNSLFAKSDSKSFEELLEKLEENISNQIVKDYVLNIKDYIIKKNVYSTIFEKIYKMKSILRTGWKESGREIDKKGRTESLAEHTWACCQLAQMLLTDNLEDCQFITEDFAKTHEEDYDKTRIIMLLLFHDLPEVETGDKLSDQKTAKNTEDEKAFMHSLRSLDSFNSFSSFRKMDDLFRKYTEGTCINARIAHDIDKIEPLVQLYIYRKLLPPTTAERERDIWIRSVDIDLKTDFGINLLDFIKKHLLLGEQWEK